MQIFKSKFLKIVSFFLCMAAITVAWLAFGDRGLIDLYSMEMQRRTCIDRINRLSKENHALRLELERLTNDMEYVESMVRKKLNLIRDNEVLYRFEKDDMKSTEEK